MASPARHLRRLLPLRSPRRHVPSPPHHPLLTRRRHQPRQPDHGLLELPPQNPPPQLADHQTHRRQPQPAPPRRPEHSHATPPRAGPCRRLSTRTRIPAASKATAGQTREHNTPDQNPRQRPGAGHAVVNAAPNKTADHQPDQSRHLIESGHKPDPKAWSAGPEPNQPIRRTQPDPTTQKAATTSRTRTGAQQRPRRVGLGSAC